MFAPVVQAGFPEDVCVIVHPDIDTQPANFLGKTGSQRAASGRILVDPAAIRNDRLFRSFLATFLSPRRT
jgi:hypothetical protein